MAVASLKLVGSLTSSFPVFHRQEHPAIVFGPGPRGGQYCFIELIVVEQVELVPELIKQDWWRRVFAALVLLPICLNCLHRSQVHPIFARGLACLQPLG